MYNERNWPPARLRLASRIIGGFMIVAALGFLAVFAFLAFSEVQPALKWQAAGFFLILASAFLLGGWSYLRYNPGAVEKEEPPSETTQFIIRHRAQLKVLAQIGLLLSLTRVATAFVYSDWLGRYSNVWLAVGVIVLFYWANKIANPNVSNNSDWQRVPEWIRRALPPLGPLVWWASIIMASGRVWFPGIFTPDNKIYVVIDRMAAGVLLSFMYGIEALYFKYGELRSAHGSEPAA